MGNLSIYRLRADYRQYMFHGSNHLIESGISINSSIYYCVYREYHADTYLLSLLSKLDEFSFEIPEAFKKLSLSVGDVVSIKHDGQFTAYYVEPVGICRTPNFVVDAVREDVQENEPKPEQKEATCEESAEELTEFQIEVEEVLQRVVTVKADAVSSAVAMVRNLYRDNKIVLDSEDMKMYDVRAYA